KVKNVYWCAPRPGPSILFLPAAAVALMGVSEQSFDGGLRRRTIDNRRFKSMVIERIVRDLLIYAMLLLAIAPWPFQMRRFRSRTMQRASCGMSQRTQPAFTARQICCQESMTSRLWLRGFRFPYKRASRSAWELQRR